MNIWTDMCMRWRVRVLNITAPISDFAGRVSLDSMHCMLPLINVYDRAIFPADRAELSDEA